MRHGIMRWTMYLIALLVLGPAAERLTSSLRAIDGGPGATLLVGESPARGLLVGLAAFVLAAIAGIVGARTVGVRAGMIAAGFVLTWAAWGTGTLDEVLRGGGSGSSDLILLAIEGLVLGALGVGFSLACVGIGRLDPVPPKPGRPRAPDAPPPSFASIRWGPLVRASLNPTAIVVGVVAGAAGAWLLAVEPHKGQCVAAALVAGLAAAAAGHVADYRAPMPAAMISVAILAVLGPLSAMVLGGDAGPLAASNAGTIPPWARPMPLDWIAGALMGVPVGTSWAAPMMSKRLETA